MKLSKKLISPNGVNRCRRCCLKTNLCGCSGYYGTLGSIVAMMIAVTGTAWVYRWVDIAQVVPPPTTERKPEPMISARALVLVFITSVLILTLATIELLFRGTIHE
jgi:hypothetical protein